MSEEEKNKYLDLEKFNYNKNDLFGHYAEIEMKFYGERGNQVHLFKIISSGINTNFYNDVPFNEHTKPAYLHKEMVDVVNVIECGIDEKNVYREPLNYYKKCINERIFNKETQKLIETYLGLIAVNGINAFCEYVKGGNYTEADYNKEYLP